MNDIITIAQSTFYRVARLKALYVILVICVLDVWAMGLYDELSLGMAQELMLDCALAMALVVGVVTAMVSAFEIPRELREKTAQFILSKPMGRSAFVWGKFLGIGGLCVFNVALVTLGSMLVYHNSYNVAEWGMMQSGLLVIVEALVLTGIGLLLSTFLTDTLAAIGVFASFAIGHALYMLPRKMENDAVGKVLSILPDFHLLDIKTALSHGVDVPMEYVGLGAAYGAAYALAVTALAVIVFSRKDIA